MLKHSVREAAHHWRSCPSRTEGGVRSRGLGLAALTRRSRTRAARAIARARRPRSRLDQDAQARAAEAELMAVKSSLIVDKLLIIKDILDFRYPLNAAYGTVLTAGIDVESKCSVRHDARQ